MKASLRVRMPTTFGKGIEGSTRNLLPGCVNGIQATLRGAPGEIRPLFGRTLKNLRLTLWLVKVDIAI